MPVIEVVANSSKLEKPGWAYVPDTGYDSTKAAAPVQTGVRKRTARTFDTSEAGLTARQLAAVNRRLTDLEKDNSRDLNVPLPSRQRPRPKTAAVRKIIESQRSLAHFLADEEALGMSEYDSGQGRARASRPKGVSASLAQSERERRIKPERASVGEGMKMTGQSRLDAGDMPPQHPLDPDERLLLQVTVPTAPSPGLMDALTLVPARAWSEVKARPPENRASARAFCELCGYWSRIRCLQCGARLCSLPCKRAHDDGRCQKYGA